MKKNKKRGLGAKLKTVREMLGYSQEELARILRVTRFSVWNWENNNSTMTFPAIISIRAIVDYRKQFDSRLSEADEYWPTMKEIVEEEEE